MTRAAERRALALLACVAASAFVLRAPESARAQEHGAPEGMAGLDEELARRLRSEGPPDPARSASWRSQSWARWRSAG